MFNFEIDSYLTLHKQCRMNYTTLPMPDACQLRQGTIAKASMETPTTGGVRRFHPYDAARLRTVGNKLEPAKLPQINSYPAVNSATMPNTTVPEMVARLPWAVQSVSIPSCGSYKIVKQKIKTDTRATAQSITKSITTINHALVLPDGQNLSQQVRVRLFYVYLFIVF